MKTLSIEERVQRLERQLEGAGMQPGENGISPMKLLEIKEVARRFAGGDRRAIREYCRRQK